MLATCSQSYHWWVVTVLNYSYSIFTADFVSLLGHRGLMAYRSNKQLAQVLFNSQRQKISIFLWASRVILQKKKKKSTADCKNGCVFIIFSRNSVSITEFSSHPPFLEHLIHLELLMFTLWSVKKGSDHPDRLHIINTALLGRSHMLSTSCACC